VRDGLSLLDQAIALSDANVTATQVQDMLGLSDRSRNMDLLEKALTADMPGALEIMDSLHQSGGAPAVILNDLLGLTHLLTKLRAAPALGELKQSLSPDQLERAKDLANKLSMPTLGKTWQILLKGLSEVTTAPNPQDAAEMVIIRLVYAADLPDPLDLIKKLKDLPAPQNAPAAPSTTPSGTPVSAPVSTMQNASSRSTIASGSTGGVETARAALHVVETETPKTAPILSTLEDMIAYLEEQGAYLLASQLFQFAHPVKLEPAQNRFEFRASPEAPPKLAQDLAQELKNLTDERWMISISSQSGQPTLAQQAEKKRLNELEEVLKHPVICDIMQLFPEAELVKVLPAEEEK
jgi:DNA polymerase-3 subunit gamma/tau